ncbi:MAG TPA: hypothetical protein VKE94_05000 [Gemmataceae bacterium]|nr:hypothetical protein [Gemmataceae bacterium]
MTAAELNPELRNLIDARLDAIERALLRVELSYSERRHIVGEVETQIFELLARRNVAPTHEDVVAVLDSLDPPESYVPEELRGKLGDVPEATIRPRARGPRLSLLAVGSAVGLVANILVAIPLLAASGPGEAAAQVFGGLMMLAVSACGVVACIRILRSEGRLQGLPFAFAAALAFPLFWINVIVVAIIAATHGIIAFVLTGAAILYVNYRAIRWLWRWLSVERGNVPQSVRTAVSGWFSPKNGIQPT